MESITKQINTYQGDELHRDQIFIKLQDLLTHPNLHENDSIASVNAATGLIFFKIGHFCNEIGFY